MGEEICVMHIEKRSVWGSFWVGLALLFLVAGCGHRGPTPGQLPDPEAIARYEEACAAYDDGHPALAKTNASAAYEIDPTHAHSTSFYARLLMQDERYDEALDVCETLNGWYPQYIPGQLLQGILWEIKGDREKAASFYERVDALTREPHTPYASNICVPIAVYLRWGTARALKGVDVSLIRFPDEPNVLALREVIKQNDRDALIKWFIASSKAARPAFDAYLPTN